MKTRKTQRGFISGAIFDGMIKGLVLLGIVIGAVLATVAFVVVPWLWAIVKPLLHSLTA